MISQILAFFKKRSDLLFVGMLVLIFFSRLPLLHINFGLDGDAYGIIKSAELLRTTGEYEASRLPGYPVVEYIYSMIPLAYGSFLHNLLTAIISLMGIACFGLIIRQVIGRDILLATLAFSFIPIVYINSTNSMDYMWALSFILLSFCLALNKKYIIAGIAVGLGIGARITSGAMILPLAILIWKRDEKDKTLTSLLLFTLTGIITAVLFYVPVLKKYGLSFFTYYNGDYPSLYRIFYHGYKVFGILGSLAVVFGLFLVVKRWSLTPVIKEEGHRVNFKVIVLVSLMVIFLYLVAYLRLPFQAGYLLPVVPFILLIFQLLVPRRYFNLIGILFILSPFLFGITKGGGLQLGALEGQVTIKGPVVLNRENRISRENRVQEIISKAEQYPDSTKIVVGSYFLIFRYATRSQPELQNRFVESFSEYDYLQNSDADVYYLFDEVDKYNKEITGFSMSRHGIPSFTKYDWL